MVPHVQHVCPLRVLPSIMDHQPEIFGGPFPLCHAVLPGKNMADNLLDVVRANNRKPDIGGYRIDYRPLLSPPYVQ